MIMKIKNFIGNIFLVGGHLLVKMGDKIVLFGVDLHIKFDTEAGRKFSKLKAIAHMMTMQTSAPKELKQNTQNKLKENLGMIYAPKKSD